MPKKNNTRRSVSLKGTTHARLYEYCQLRGLALAAVVDELINDECDKWSIPAASNPRPFHRKKTTAEQAEEIREACFTW